MDSEAKNNESCGAAGKKKRYSFKDDATIIYSDNLIEITDESILFREYYLSFKDKRVPLSEIDHIDVKKGGNARIYGTGNFRTWFPWDCDRPSRDRIFTATLRSNKWVKIGFTVEDPEKVQKILQDKKLLAKDENE